MQDKTMQDGKFKYHIGFLRNSDYTWNDQAPQVNKIFMAFIDADCTHPN